MPSILVTGATGYIGSIVVSKLLERGYKVVGSARNEESAQRLRSKGAEAIVVDLRETEKFAEIAKRTDGVLHLGFVHDFTRMEESVEIDKNITRAFIEALEGTGKPLITTSGSIAYLDSGDPVKLPRRQCEVETHKGKDRGVRTIVIRLPMWVYGNGGSFFLPLFIQTSKNRKEAPYLGDGQRMISAVHVIDAAEFYILAMEKGVSGATYNAVSENVTIKSMAEAVAKMLGISARSVSREELDTIWGHFAMFFTISQKDPGDPGHLEWHLGNQPSLFEDINGSYKTTL